VELAVALHKLRIDVTGAVRLLTWTLVANQDASVRRLAAEAFSCCGKNELDVVPALLLAALNDKDETVRELAEASLVHLKLSHEQASLVCSRQLKESLYAEKALRAAGQLAVSGLVEALKVNEPTVQEKALRTLSGLGEVAAGAAPAITKVLLHRNLEVRLAAAKCLWNLTKQPDPVVPVLIELLKAKWPAANGDDSRRRYVQTTIEALWRIGPPAIAAIPALTHLTKDHNRHVGESALRAIRHIKPS
jgi:hypothetical protein